MSDYLIDPSVTLVTITPGRTLIGTLSQIGGLLVIFKFSTILLAFIHQKMFERTMRKEVTADDFKKVYSFSNFSEALIKIHELENKNEELEARTDQLNQVNEIQTQQIA